ncbi:unnamed protein product [Linum trigynum]|uniref:Uncharacterized protein n=2 Tax=Linum trigynum TaxID=586398 RepID=A0AAV2DA83_9ROSI
MGRRIPSTNDRYNLESTHPVFSVSLFIAGMAAVIAISTTLCGYGVERKLESKSSSMSPSSTKVAAEDENSETSEGGGKQEKCRDLDEEGSSHGSALPLPPSKQLRATYSCNNFVATTSISRKNLTKAMSMNLKRSVSEAKKQDREERKIKREKMRNEDSVWMKTIILGEKCKVPDQEDDMDVIFDGKGRKVSAYHPRTMSSYGLSRTNSSIDHTAIPSSSQSLDGGDHHQRKVSNGNNIGKREGEFSS